VRNQSLNGPVAVSGSCTKTTALDTMTTFHFTDPFPTPNPPPDYPPSPPYPSPPLAPTFARGFLLVHASLVVAFCPHILAGRAVPNNQEQSDDVNGEQPQPLA